MSRPAPCGWLLLDKPVGPSSAQALARVKRLFQAPRAGHAGTLDPLASGLLAIALGPATRWCGYLLEAPKAYRFTIRLGRTTESQDAESLNASVAPAVEIPTLDPAEIKTLLSRFTGTIRQTPPMHSALRSGGRRLYELAREGRVVERPAREVRIERLELLADHGGEWELQVRCGKGTYVRTLGHDLGQALGCGAYVSALRRTGLGRFDESDAVGLEQLETAPEAVRRARLLPADAALPKWPVHACTAREEQALRRGQRVAHSGAAGFWKLQGADGSFFGVAEALDSGWLQPRRLMADS